MTVSSPFEMLSGRHTREHRTLLPEQGAALEAVAGVVMLHLEEERKNPTDGPAPMLIQIDGPGNCDLVNMVAHQLDPGVDDAHGGKLDAPAAGSGDSVGPPERPWSVVRFDAWQYQRVAPPWWWLVAAFDQALREQFRSNGAAVARRKRLRDYRWRVAQFLIDLLPVLPLVAAALVLWFISGQLAMGDFLKWAAGLLGGLTTLTAFLWSATTAVRHLLVTSPASGPAATRTRDPMADLKLRYSFLIRSSDRPLLLVIDNLDRCRADYVVELLEGLQTLLTNPDADVDSGRLVAVLIPAERAWLCDSYVQVYKEFGEAMRQPGRPFGLAFVDRVFDLALRLPPVVPSDENRVAPRDALDKIEEADSEGDIRDVVAEVEQKCGNGPAAQLRLAAVRKLGSLEVTLGDCVCFDTARVLKELVRSMPVGATVVNRVRTAYCVHRTTQLLGGHSIDRGENGIRRLGLWTILDLRWPLLAQHLARNPDDIGLLRTRTSPTSVTEDLEQVFSDPEAARLATLAPGLTGDDVRRFTCSYMAAESWLVPTAHEFTLR